MSGQHVKLRNERTIAFDLGKRDSDAPRHRVNVWRVIAQMPLYLILEDTLTGETRTAWIAPEPVEL